MLGLESPGTDGYVDGNGAALTLGGEEPDLPVKNASLWDDWGLGTGEFRRPRGVSVVWTQGESG